MEKVQAKGSGVRSGRGARVGGRASALFAAAAFLAAAALLAAAGCFPAPDPGAMRDDRVLQALREEAERPSPPSPLSPEQAVVYALQYSLDSRVAELELAYQDENLAASRLRMLPSLTARYSVDRNNHPAARWSRSLDSGRESLESSYSSEQTARRSEVSFLWSILDFGVGYLKARQQAERVLSARLQTERVRQQIVLDVLSRYWHAAFTESVAVEAEALQEELESHAESIRDSVDMRILSGAEGARRELVVHSGLADLAQWRRAAAQAKLDLARVMGAGARSGFALEPFPAAAFRLPAAALRNPDALQAAALRRRPELYRSDADERIALDDARSALLQIAPNATLSLSLNNDPDQFIEWNNWMVVGARASWNLFSIPSRLAERRAAQRQEELSREKGLALAAAVMAQVGMAWSDFRLSHEHAVSLRTRAAARERLVSALAAGEEDGQARSGEVLQERVRLLTERAAALRAAAEAMIAGARLANAVGVVTDDTGAFVWQVGPEMRGSAAGENARKSSRNRQMQIAARKPAAIPPAAAHATGQDAVRVQAAAQHPAGPEILDVHVPEQAAAVIRVVEQEAAVAFPPSVAGVRVERPEAFRTPEAEAPAVEEDAPGAPQAEEPAPAPARPQQSFRLSPEEMEGIERNLEAEREAREAAAQARRERRRERLLRGGE